MRVLEIGDRALFAREMPDATRLIWTGKRLEDQAELKGEPATLRNLINNLIAMQKGQFDMVVWHPPEKSPWHEFVNGRRDTRAWRLYFLSLLLKIKNNVPFVVLDTRDRADITPHIFPVLAKSDIYFKRELPLDETRLFPSGASRRQQRFILKHLNKMHPVSLGLDAWKVTCIPDESLEKTSDVFFSGQSHTKKRKEEISLIRSLTATGVRVDIPAEKLSREDFYRRCAAAWLVWSPEGLGWQCFRHYEASACRSVPVMNTPWIKYPMPLREAEHAFYYDNRNTLVDVITQALADKNKLRRMAEAGRQHVLTHHTHAAMCRMIREASLVPGHAGHNI